MTTKTNTEINGNNYYRIRRTIDGKIKNFYGTSKGDAEKQYKRYLEELAEARHAEAVEFDSATFSFRADEFINNTLKVSQKYAKGTITSYIGQYNIHIKGTWLDDTPIKDIKASTIQKFYNELDVSQSAIKNINKFMSAFNKWLVLNGYAPDFMSAVEIPKKKQNHRHDEIIVWSDEEIRSIFDALESLKSPHRQAFLIKLLLYTGMRISEALGLKYSDIKDGIIHVERQYYLGELKEPKWNSKRQIPMHEELLVPFEEHTKWHQAEMKKNHYKTDFVFTTSAGNLYHQSSVRKALVRFYENNNIPYKHIHAYRATFCTQLCRCGIPLEVASKLLGHKSMEVTAVHYALVRQDSMRDAIDKLTF